MVCDTAAKFFYLLAERFGPALQDGGLGAGAEREVAVGVAAQGLLGGVAEGPSSMSLSQARMVGRV